MAETGSEHEVTRLLDAIAADEPSARDEFYRIVYNDLKRLARGHLSRQSTLTNLDAPALVNEAYLRLVHRGTLRVNNRAAFFGYASAVMRSVIIDYVRERAAKKRGGDVGFQTLTTGLAADYFVIDEVESLHEALQQLLRIDQRLHDVVEMRYFGGLSIEEVAQVMGVSAMTVKRDWQKARAYLFTTLKRDYE